MGTLIIAGAILLIITLLVWFFVTPSSYREDYLDEVNDFDRGDYGIYSRSKRRDKEYYRQLWLYERRKLESLRARHKLFRWNDYDGDYNDRYRQNRRNIYYN